MRGAFYHRCGVDACRVLRRGDVDMGDRVADLLLEQGLRLPRHAGIGIALHQEQRRLAVVDVGEDRRAVLDLGLVDGPGEVRAAGLLERRFDLPHDTLEGGVRHDEPKPRLAQVGEPGHVRRVALRNHDRQRIAHIGERRPDERAVGDKLAHLLQPGEIDVGLCGESQVANCHGAARRDLLGEQAGRDRLPEKPALKGGVFHLERLHERCHREEVIAADVKHELGVGEVAVEVGHDVGLRHGEIEAAHQRVVVGPVLPGRVDARVVGFWPALLRGHGPRSEHRGEHERAQEGLQRSHASWLISRNETRPLAAPGSCRRRPA